MKQIYYYYYYYTTLAKYNYSLLVKTGNEPFE